MNDHLSSATLNELVDGELAGEELALVNSHLLGCPQCTSSVLAVSLLKSATGRAGQRYVPASDLRERLANLLDQEPLRTPSGPLSELRPARGLASYGWVAAAATLLICGTLFGVLRNEQRREAESSQVAELVTEVCDQHIASLATNAPPEVISSDRHTVKPWFQGKLPFSFNLPQNLPADTTLDGADLTYLHNQPTAQLLYSIGKHHVSVFLQQRTGSAESGSIEAGHSGFYVKGFHTDDLQVVAVSDVDPARLADLLDRLKQAQPGTQGRPQ